MVDEAPQFGRIPYGVIAAGVIADMKPADAKLYLALCAHVGRDWVATPGMRRLASVCGMHLGSVSRSMKRLVNMGVIARVDEQCNGEKGVYRICLTVHSGVNAFQGVTVHPPVTHRSLGRERSKTPDRSPGRNEPFTHAQQTVHRGVNETEGTERTEGEAPPLDSDSPNVESQPTLPGIPADPPQAEPGKAVVFTFPTRGGGAWTMSRDLLWRLREEHPYLHVDSKLHSLIAWTQGNPDKRKTAGAMMSWLRGLLARDNAEALQRSDAQPARYEGWCHASLPTDPTVEEARALIFADTEDAA